MVETLLGFVSLSGPAGSPNQLWHWMGAAYPPLQFELAAEEFDSQSLVSSFRI
jgi:hypothetical protein